jgi:hypothetical protein
VGAPNRHLPLNQRQVLFHVQSRRCCCGCRSGVSKTDRPLLSMVYIRTSTPQINFGKTLPSEQIVAGSWAGFQRGSIMTERAD